MEHEGMTALVSAFSRWYHAEHNVAKVFDDTMAGHMLTETEKNTIAESMSKGIVFFNPTFRGNKEEALRWIVDNQLSPSPLGRAAFCERHLEEAAQNGTQQYLVLAAGYDTFAYRQPHWARYLEIYEIDHPAMVKDKQMRLISSVSKIPVNVHFILADFLDSNWIKALHDEPTFDTGKISFCSMLGISYYLTKECFKRLLHMLSEIMPKGSRIVFDYPDQDSYTQRAGVRAQKQAILAGGANEKMLSCYSQSEMEGMLDEYALIPVEHLIPEEITTLYFGQYNAVNPSHTMTAFDNVNYCLALKR